MEHRQLKLLVSLVAVLLAMTTWLVVSDPPPDEPADDSEELVALIDVDPAEVTGLTLETDEGELVAVRHAEGWLLSRPLATRGDDQALDEIALTVSRLTFSDPLPGAPASFGLDRPRAVLELRRSGEPLVLTVGSRAPVGHKAYVSLADGQPRYVSGDPGDTLARGFATFRDAAIHSLPTSAVRRATWSADEGLDVLRDDQGWWLADGRRARAERVEVWLQALAELRLDSFWDELSDQDAGFSPPRGQLDLETEAGVETILLGADHTGGVLVKTPSGVVGTIPDASRLSRSTSDVLEDRLLSIDVLGADELSIDLGDAKVAFTRSHTGWASAAGPVDEEQVAQLLAATQVDRTVLLEPTAEHGRLVARTATHEVTVVLGDEVDGGRVGWEPERRPAFLVPDDALATIEAAVTGAWAVPE